MSNEEKVEERYFSLPGLSDELAGKQTVRGFRRVQIALGFTLLLLGSVAAFSFWSSRELTTSTQQLANAYQLRQYQAELHAAIGDAEFLQWGILLARYGTLPEPEPLPGVGGLTPPAGGAEPFPDPLEAYQVTLDRARAAIEGARRVTLGDPAMGEQGRLISELEPLVAARITQFQRLVEEVFDEEGSAATWLALAGQGVVLTSQIHDRLDQLTGPTREQVQLRLENAEATATATRGAAAAGLLLAVILVLLVATMVREDLAKRQRRELALRRSQKEMHQFLKGMPLGVVVADASRKIVYTNPLSDDLLGDPFVHSADGTVLVDDLPIVVRGSDMPYPADRLPILKALAGESGSVEDAELRVGHRRLPVALSAEPIRDHSGTVTFAVSTVVDISERLEAKEQLVRARQMAEEASRAKSDFLARMSHELRTPLNSVIGFTNVLLKNKHERLVPSDLFYLERIRHGGCHLLEVINGILDLARVEAGRTKIELSEVRLDELVRDTLAGFEGQVMDRPIRLEYNGPGSAVTTVTDSLKFKQILINLVGNALKFTRDGSISVVLQTDPETGRPTRLDVRDTGIGIPEEQLETIFEAFEQVDSGTDRQHDGTGLGLAITRAICGELGYRIEVESRVGEGSVFTIHFPAEEAEEASVPMHAAAPSKRSSAPPVALPVQSDEEPEDSPAPAPMVAEALVPG